jgi:RNA polymerase sigma-70 factor (ECF subfamily)
MQALHQSDLQDLYDLSEAEQIDLGVTAFGEALAVVGQRFLHPNATCVQQVAFYRQLHLRDFALAQSCSRGNAAAWERFVERFKNGLYGAAMLIAKNESMARELSDSLAGDLFVYGKPSGEQRSRLASYSGRGSLEGWLKALLTHAYIDSYRSRQRTVSLENRFDLLRTLCASQDFQQPEPDSRLNLAIQAALSQRTSEERFLLSAYFFDAWTLAEISNVLGVHESSASRRLNKIVKELRRSVSRSLHTAGMSTRQIEESFTAGVSNVSIDLRELLIHGFVRE